MVTGVLGAGYTGSYIFSQTVFTMRQVRDVMRGGREVGGGDAGNQVRSLALDEQGFVLPHFGLAPCRVPLTNEPRLSHAAGRLFVHDTHVHTYTHTNFVSFC